MKLIGDVSKEKLRGGFYTPDSIVKFILRWAMNGDTNYDILEPSCGDGAFLKQLKENGFKYNSVTAIEIDKIEAQKALDVRTPKASVLNQDFYAYCNSTKDRFDLVVGNPPYIRYQYFDKEQRIEAEDIFTNAGLKYSKLNNAWVSFVVGSSLLLKETGKIGFVIPAEILQVSYAKQLRNFLARFYNRITIISFKKLVFPVQQEVVLLLCEKTHTNSHLIEHLELECTDKLKTLDVAKLKSPKKKIDFKSNKWTFYFLDQNEIDFIERVLHQEDMSQIRNYATVEVGMTTGFNKFFTVPLSTLKDYQLQEYARPMVGRSVQVPSVIFNKRDWELNVKLGARAHFLKFPSLKEIRKNKKALQYIEEGEQRGIHKGYKCRIRDEWQIMPSAWVSDALFIRRNNIYPRLIINKARAYTTDTMHRVTVNKGVNLEAFVASYYNSLSLAFAEICGRSHGGGVLELMPNEVEDIPLPYSEDNAEILKQIDKTMREKKDIDEILQFTNKTVLKEGYGFSASDIKLADGIRRKLLMRRMNRSKAR